MTRLNPPFRAEHVGSLLRPRNLKDAAKGFSKGDISESEYQETLRQEIERVVKLQESVGLHSITDGEFSRSSWFGFFFERLEGFTLEPSLFRFHDDGGHDEAASNQEPRRQRLSQNQRAEYHGHDRVDVCIGAHGAGGKLVQAVRERGEANERPDSGEVDEPAPSPR